MSTQLTVGPVWVKGEPPYGVWFGWVKFDEESILPSVITVCETANGSNYLVNGEIIHRNQIIKYLDNSGQQVFTIEQLMEACLNFYWEFINTDRITLEMQQNWMNTNYPSK